MLTDKVKREIDARLASVVNENETFIKYLLAEDDEYVEEKLNPEYKLWYKLAQIRHQIALNARDALVTHELLRHELLRFTPNPFKRKDLEAEQRELECDMDALYAKAVHYLKEYDRYYSPDGELSKMLDISPNLYEAKINLEDSKGSTLFEQNLKAYNQLIEQEAKANGVSPSEVMRYMDEAYEEALEDWNWDFLKGKSFSDAQLWQFDA